MDALSEVLKSVHLEGAVFLNAEFTAPWCVRGESGMAIYKQRLRSIEHVVFFHFLIEGCCKVRLTATGQVLEVTAGDLVLLPQDDLHIMGSDLQMAPLGEGGTRAPEVLADPDFIQLRYGGGGAATRFVCGYLSCNRNMLRPLFEALPRMLRIPIGDGQASALLRELLQAGVRESQDSRPGTATALAKLAELIFVEAMRRYAQSLPPEGKGWLAGLRDVHIGRALALLHGDPARPWTVDELAHAVALSRSALAERFSLLVGEAPMQYLTRWRLALAAQMLRTGKDAVARVAERSGYESEAAFSRAFKREFGASPMSWRKGTTDSARANQAT
jgi:AraC-like DNA-binding protein